VTVVLDGAGLGEAPGAAVEAMLRGLRWGVSSAEGVRPVAHPTAVVETGTRRVTLTFAIAAPTAPAPVGGEQLHFLRAAIPHPAEPGGEDVFPLATAFAFSFRTARLSVAGTGVRPSAAFYNDGLLDISKDFKPFGPIPREGDAFYLRADEALGKRLTRLKLWFDDVRGAAKPIEVPPAQRQMVMYSKQAMSMSAGGFSVDVGPGGASFGTPAGSVKVTTGPSGVTVTTTPAAGGTGTSVSLPPPSEAVNTIFEGIEETGNKFVEGGKQLWEWGEKVREEIWKGSPLPGERGGGAVGAAPEEEFVEVGPGRVDVGPAPGGVVRELPEVQWAGAPELRWQLYDGTLWQPWVTKNALATFAQAITAPDRSAATTIGGQHGNYVRAVLRKDFGWGAYERQLEDNAAKIAGDTTKTFRSVSKPDPPAAGSIFVEYQTAEDSFALGTLRVFERNEPGALHEHRVSAASVTPFRRATAEGSGVFQLGLGDIPLGEVVTLAFNLVEADACQAIPAKVELAWEYRRAIEGQATGGWADLRVVDTTSGLRQTGIVRFVAPQDWATGNDDADSLEGAWIRVWTSAPSLAGRIVRIATDAVEAVYVPAPERPRAYETAATPLPAGGVKGLKVAIPGVKGCTNPIPSWGGRDREREDAFLRRAPEVLRHRNRACTPWDCERLVIAHFPELALARCLPHHSDAPGPEAECAPGWITMVLVPDSADRRPVPTIRLAERVKRFLAERGTPWLNVSVRCAEYTDVRVEADVQLRPGTPAGEAAERVERDLREFLWPLGGRRGAAEFGATLYRSSVVAFFEEHELVEYATGVRMLAQGPADPQMKGPLEYVEVNGCSGLVASAEQHGLDPTAAL
nr:hypothetical protein [Actinomycetota bacterium]